MSKAPSLVPNFKYQDPTNHLTLLTAFANIETDKLDDPTYKTTIDVSLALDLRNQIKDEPENPDYQGEKPYVNASIISVQGLSDAFETRSAVLITKQNTLATEVLEGRKTLNAAAKELETQRNLYKESSKSEQNSTDLSIVTQQYPQIEALSRNINADLTAKTHIIDKLKIAIPNFSKLNPFVQQGYSTIHLAAHFNFPELLKTLLELDAEPNLPASIFPADSADPNIEQNRAEIVLYLQTLDDHGVQLIKNDPDVNLKKLLTTPMLILANIADEVATDNMKELLNNLATLRYIDACVYYSQVYKTIQVVDQRNTISSADLAKYHTDLFLFCLEGFMNNKDIYIPQLKELVKVNEAKKSQSGLNETEEQNLQDLKKALRIQKIFKKISFLRSKIFLKLIIIFMILTRNIKMASKLLWKNLLKDLLDFQMLEMI